MAKKPSQNYHKSNIIDFPGKPAAGSCHFFEVKVLEERSFAEEPLAKTRLLGPRSQVRLGLAAGGRGGLFLGEDEEPRSHGARLGNDFLVFEVVVEVVGARKTSDIR